MLELSNGQERAEAQTAALTKARQRSSVDILENTHTYTHIYIWVMTVKDCRLKGRYLLEEVRNAQK